MSMPLARYLKDFSAPPAPPQPIESPFGMAGEDDFDMEFPALPEPEPEPIDLEAERREAFAEGHAAGEREAVERLEAERQVLETAHAEAMAELEQRLRDEFASALTTKLPEVAKRLSLAVSEQVAHALAPLIEEHIVEKAVAELADQLEAAVLAGEGGTIQIRGPRDLFEKLQSHMPDHGEMLRHVEGVDLDLTAEFGETALVTRISAFSASLKKVLS
ncbi:GTPase [Rhizobium glycinendophyticum]|uniref:GTPase n=1 Tax=Rhizobium glycinendophyticum TaxID=2589807 RepID=A0A504U4G8_9HYPH|nr:GTPase [Rhizobium glycinendophyticum]TPP09848.1 GTPase [Rhizobium glycinendophyticum]